MSDLIRNIDARDRLTAIILGKAVHEVAPKQLNAAEAADALNGHHYKQPGMATPEDCMHWAKQVAKHLGQEAYESLLSRNGMVERPLTLEHLKNGLWAGYWQRFVDYAKTAVYFGLSPQWAWDVNVSEFAEGKYYQPFIREQITRKPVEELRGRWLLYHAESESLFTVESWQRAIDCSEGSGEEINDVTGVETWEQRFAAEGGNK